MVWQRLSMMEGTMMDAYCERIGPGLFAEPLNAVSNVSFLIAAWAAWILATRTGTLATGVKVLIALAASVGIGSILWHTLANAWTLILDIVPIVIFLIWYIWLYTRTVIGLRSRFAGAAVAAFLLATFLVIPYAGVLHGALVYTPGLLVALVLGVFHARERRVARFTLLAAAGVYFAALFFRTIDQEVCPVLPIGTHFIWHTLDWPGYVPGNADLDPEPRLGRRFPRQRLEEAINGTRLVLPCGRSGTFADWHDQRR